MSPSSGPGESRGLALCSFILAFLCAPPQPPCLLLTLPVPACAAGRSLSSQLGEFLSFQRHLGFQESLK